MKNTKNLLIIALCMMQSCYGSTQNNGSGFVWQCFSATPEHTRTVNQQIIDVTQIFATQSVPNVQLEGRRLAPLTETELRRLGTLCYNMYVRSGCPLPQPVDLANIVLAHRYRQIHINNTMGDIRNSIPDITQEEDYDTLDRIDRNTRMQFATTPYRLDQSGYRVAPNLLFAGGQLILTIVENINFEERVRRILRAREGISHHNQHSVDATNPWDLCHNPGAIRSMLNRMVQRVANLRPRDNLTDDEIYTIHHTYFYNRNIAPSVISDTINLNRQMYQNFNIAIQDLRASLPADDSDLLTERAIQELENFYFEEYGYSAANNVDLENAPTVNDLRDQFYLWLEGDGAESTQDSNDDHSIVSINSTVTDMDISDDENENGDDAEDGHYLAQ